MQQRRPTKSIALSALGACLAVGAPVTAAKADSTRPQLVIISFDGAHDNALWTKSREIARETGAHFTYFLSCTFLMSQEMRARYQAPHQKPGRSNVGFAQSQEEVRTRLKNIWAAHEEGHEMASHACGHFDGKDWTKADWKIEFSSFHDTLLNAWEGSRLEAEKPAGWADFVNNDITGFRAPYLSQSAGLAPALKASGYRYDASGVSKGAQMPQMENGLARFALPRVPEGPKQRRIIAMDYNLFVRHSAGVENRKRSDEFEARAYDAFTAAFAREYEGDRTPLQLGFHFVEMNGGAYWRAMAHFAADVCHKADVKCVTYSEALDLLATTTQSAEADTKKAGNPAF